MARWILIIIGVLWLLFLNWIPQLSDNTQSILFFSGILLLGVPHGAADLLIANRFAADKNHVFRVVPFLIRYLGRLFLFGVVLYFFPLTGNILFILFAAYHFGETDLYLFSIENIAGKLFVISYGFLILAVILLPHFTEVKPLFQLFVSGNTYIDLLNWIDLHRYHLLSFFGLLFFAATFFYFATQNALQQVQGLFLVQLALILFILYHLPMLLGFTFYFVIWHSLLSLRNIVRYLQKDGMFSIGTIVKQIVFFSVLAIIGIGLFGISGFMFVNRDTMIVYLFLGLAVLTAPHMQIMHSMYQRLRSSL